MSRPEDTHRAELPKNLRDLFAGPPDSGAGDACLDEEQLAAWLDQTLEEAEQLEALKHLTQCRHCQTRLVALYRDIAFAWDPDAPLPVVDKRLQGVLVKWVEPSPAREGNGQQKPVEVADREKSKDGNGSDDEERKRRFVSGQS